MRLFAKLREPFFVGNELQSPVYSIYPGMIGADEVLFACAATIRDGCPAMTANIQESICLSVLTAHQQNWHTEKVIGYVVSKFLNLTAKA